ncbi:cupin domain-containing protein [Jiangella mangrovi]|uniref:Gentisate 1,2-dioxygenase n=1 Tax=Jiangella mangrovi TaxID=1524084 RepID=A0A7W9GQP3_9ACTN|nr:cupin domain-containing protein [Jiangella mangrovi]MBB5788137.1 gentisate 1,2-dioxygenase [Jiangella mangrovi]
MAQMKTEGASHYDIQNERRDAQKQLWRKHQTALIKGDSVAMLDSPHRRTRRGIYKGPEGESTSVLMDASVHEISPGITTTTHRHSWDAIMFVIGGSGWTEIGGQRIEFKPWDTIHIPAWEWHRHGNTGTKDVRYFTWSMEPMLEWFGLATLEDAGDEAPADLPPPPTSGALSDLFGLDGGDPYTRRLTRLVTSDEQATSRRLHTAWDDVTQRVSRRGARSSFLVDSSLGYQTSGLSAVMHELAPGLWQAQHRHGGEAHLYIVSGNGHTKVDGVPHHWTSGDLAVVDHWCWHQHCNDDPDKTARVIRVHSTFGTLMRALMHPLPILEEDPDRDRPDLSNVVWPDPNIDRPEA